MTNCTAEYGLGQATEFDFLGWPSIMEAFDGSVPAATTLVRNRRLSNARNRLPNAHPRENNCNITNSVVIVVAQEQLDFAPLSVHGKTAVENPQSRACERPSVLVGDIRLHFARS
jgi:hypothetical protein